MVVDAGGFMKKLKERGGREPLCLGGEDGSLTTHLPAHQFSGGDQKQQGTITALSSSPLQPPTSPYLSSLSFTLLSFLHAFSLRKQGWGNL